MVASFRPANATIKSIQVSRRDEIVINSTDRVVRVYQLGTDPRSEPELQQKFQDLVNRIQWAQACFSCDGDYVVAGSTAQAGHHIYIWDKNMGNLIKILEGPKDGLLDVTVPAFIVE